MEQQEHSNTCDCKGCTWMKNSKMMHCHFGRKIIKLIFVLFIFWLGVQVGMVKSFSHMMRGNQFYGESRGGMMRFDGMNDDQFKKGGMMGNVQIEQPVVAPSATDTAVPPKQ